MSQRESPLSVWKELRGPRSRHFLPAVWWEPNAVTLLPGSPALTHPRTHFCKAEQKRRSDCWALNGGGRELAPWKLRTGNFSLTHHIIFIFGFSDVNLSVSASILTLCAPQVCPLAPVTPLCLPTCTDAQLPAGSPVWPAALYKCL